MLPDLHDFQSALEKFKTNPDNVQLLQEYQPQTGEDVAQLMNVFQEINKPHLYHAIANTIPNELFPYTYPYLNKEVFYSNLIYRLSGYNTNGILMQFGEAQNGGKESFPFSHKNHAERHVYNEDLFAFFDTYKKMCSILPSNTLLDISIKLLTSTNFYSQMCKPHNVLESMQKYEFQNLNENEISAILNKKAEMVSDFIELYDKIYFELVPFVIDKIKENHKDKHNFLALLVNTEKPKSNFPQIEKFEDDLFSVAIQDKSLDIFNVAAFCKTRFINGDVFFNEVYQKQDEIVEKLNASQEKHKRISQLFLRSNQAKQYIKEFVVESKIYKTLSTSINLNKKSRSVFLKHFDNLLLWLKDKIEYDFSKNEHVHNLIHIKNIYHLSLLLDNLSDKFIVKNFNFKTLTNMEQNEYDEYVIKMLKSGLIDIKSMKVGNGKFDYFNDALKSGLIEKDKYEELMKLTQKKQNINTRMRLV